MKKRTLSGIILLIILIGSLIINVKLFNLVILIVALLGFNEAFNAKYNKKKEYMIVKNVAILNLLILLFNNTFYKFDIVSIMAFSFLSLTIPIIIYKDYKMYNIMDAFYILGMVYILGLAFLNIINLSGSNLEKCIFIFIIAFISDTYAYIGGSLIGKHKLTILSPNKTVEGVIIGVVMGTIIGGIYYIDVVTGLTLAQSFALCLFLSLLSVIGDLIFSSVKRCFNEKDFANLIPGHGGILDRFDSVIYVSLGLYIIMSII